MIVGVWGQSLSPGNEQREYWGSAAAEKPASRNIIGIKNPAVDHLIGKKLSQDNIEQAAQLLSETTECLSDRYASAEYRANLIRIETRRALFALSS